MEIHRLPVHPAPARAPVRLCTLACGDCKGCCSALLSILSAQELKTIIGERRE